MARVAADEDPDQLLRYLDARAELADRTAAVERSPEARDAQRRERRLQRLLIAMVVLIVAGGFILSIVALLLGLGSAQ